MSGDVGNVFLAGHCGVDAASPSDAGSLHVEPSMASAENEHADSRAA